MSLVVELGPAKDGREGEEEQHAVEEDEPANGRVAILKQHHRRDQPNSRPLEVQLLGGEVRERNAERAEGGIEQAHKSIVELFRVCLSRFEFEGSIVSCQVPRQADEHFAQRRVYIEVKFALEVV